VAVFFLYAFIRAVKSGQYDDDFTPSVRMLFDDELKKNPNKKPIQTIKEKQV
jgi:cbb3-type cytochrome oxidase maturation protein